MCVRPLGLCTVCLAVVASNLTSKRIPTIDAPKAPWERVAVVGGEAERKRADDEAMDFFNIASLVFGMLGYFFKVRPAVAGSLQLCAGTLATPQAAPSLASVDSCIAGSETLLVWPWRSGGRGV
jgi:hypothetical protein